jgi:nitroreductase
MDFRELATSRRSTRRYKKDLPVPREHLELCADSARLSPSACHSQPWTFVIVDDKTLCSKIYKDVISGIHKINSFASDATAFIAIVSEKVKPPAWAGGKLMGTDFGLVDAGIACAHIVLQAEDLGIGACILGWFNERRLKKILSIPRGKKVKLLIAMGYPEERPVRERSLKPRDKTVSVNGYDLP